ncbi:hypothetical protein BDZ85DRAFT_262949 [Elsinoe ampelina]|uniref:Uncharacterized protein n=1 Tax=Elsinoe ampelina TaxID=302913 RepID=A0A6A6GBZ6_9PEZI|nr:hypothetical protein BDZ85DRAFT_262949 [Elsinoe ampelina]
MNNETPLDDTKSIASTVLPPYGSEDVAPPPSYQPIRYKPLDLHIKKFSSHTTLEYDDGKNMLLDFKTVNVRPSLFLHDGPAKTDPIIISSKMTIGPVQERFCYADHRVEGFKWASELEKAQNFGTCSFKLPPEYGGRHLKWHFGDPKHKFKGDWILKDINPIGPDGHGPEVCSFSRPGKEADTFHWLGDVSREEELAAIVVLMIMYIRFRDDRRLGVKDAYTVGNVAFYAVAGLVYTLSGGG